MCCSRLRPRPIIISEQRNAEKEEGGAGVELDSVSVASFCSNVNQNNSTSKIVLRRKSFSAKKQKDKLDGFSSSTSSSTTTTTINGCLDNEAASDNGNNNTLRVRTSCSDLTIGTERGRDIKRTRKLSFENKAPVVKSKSVDNHTILHDISKKSDDSVKNHSTFKKSSRSVSLTRTAFSNELGTTVR